MLRIKDLHVCLAEKEILKGVNLCIGPGEVHVLMGVNGSGKSTLSYTLIGRGGYDIISGDIIFNENSIIHMSTYERACLGIFLAFQSPIEIPGITCMTFLQKILSTHRMRQGILESDLVEDVKFIRKEAENLNISADLLKRPLNEGFSGGEKKRFEVLQMAIIQPIFSILDELDSGLDIDSVKQVALSVNKLRSNQRSVLLITHYQRLLEYIIPDFVHIFIDGRIVETGNKDLALRLEREGYRSFYYG